MRSMSLNASPSNSFISLYIGTLGKFLLSTFRQYLSISQNPTISSSSPHTHSAARLNPPIPLKRSSIRISLLQILLSQRLQAPRQSAVGDSERIFPIEITGRHFIKSLWSQYPPSLIQGLNHLFSLWGHWIFFYQL